MLSTRRICIAIIAAALLPSSGFRMEALAPPAIAEVGQQAGPGSAAGAPIKVSGVTLQKGGSGESFVDIATSGQATYRLLELKNPQRLVVDLEGAQNAAPRRSYQADSSLLRRVRVAQYQGKDPAIVRVVAELKGDPAFTVHPIPGGVRIELRPRAAVMAAAPSSGNPQQAQVPPPGEQPSPPPAGAPVAMTPQQQAAQAAAAAQAPPQPAPLPAVQPMPPQNVPPQILPFYRKLPSRSLTQNEKLLDTLGLRIVMGYNYRKGTPEEAAWKTKGAPGVEAFRHFIRTLGPESYRTVELAVAASPQGGYDLVVYGQQIDHSASAPNPDLPMIQGILNDEITRIEQAPPAPDLLNLSYQTYYLSYITADRALALLKTLGYTTVEYNGQAGEGLFQTIYNPVKLGSGKPPIVVKLIDSTKTSLMEPTPSGAAAAQGAVGMPQGVPMPVGQQMGGGMGTTGVPAIGGTYLHQMTSGEPQERLLLLFDKNDPDSLQALINVLESTVDVASRQVMIEAQVIEVNVNKTLELGVTFETVQNGVDVANAGEDQNGNALSIFTFTKGAPSVANFTAALQALLIRGEAQILSNPSVLVLDDRQARIQVGQQVPVSQEVTSLGTTVSSVSYFPVGIVLNLRPRITEDGSEITMQTETIVSAINKAATTSIVGTATLVAPVVDNRQVQSIVRVADNTPFIIGGLISTNETKSITGIPFLSDIPLLGNLFRSSNVSRTKQEVIIVITPHVIPPQDKYFSYVIPKDTSPFDHFDTRLFRNSYRLRGRDIFDLGFIRESDVYQQLVKHVMDAAANNSDLKNEKLFELVLQGGAPGEYILVERMLWEIIDKTDYGRFVNTDRIVFPENNLSAPGGMGWDLAFLNAKVKNLKHKQDSLALTFEAEGRGSEERPFAPPKAVVSYPSVTPQTCANSLINGNAHNPDGTPLNWMILLAGRCPPMRVSNYKLLQEVLVLKRLLELNKDMPLTLKEFHIGRQIVFPSQEELQQGNPFIDREVARLFYEVFNYYPAFEQEFNRQARLINARLEKAHSQ